MELFVTVHAVNRSSLRRSLGLPERVKVNRQGVVTTWNLAWRTHNLLHVYRFSLSDGYVNDIVNVSDPHVIIID